MAGRSFFNVSEEQPKPTKETLLNSLEDLENELKKLGHVTLEEQLKELRKHVKNVLENQEEEIEFLRNKILSLEKEVKRQKAKTEPLEKALALAQATWAWEKHLARFVVHSSTRIYPSGWNDQMQDYLNETNKEHDRFDRIQAKLTKWTHHHWRVIKNVTRERNCMVHPNLIDLDLVESEILNMSPKHQVLLRDMLEELKMTAALMKFGRLAKHTRTELGVHGKEWNQCAMNEIISWDCKFEEIDGLQNIEHEEAKEYLTKYVDDPENIFHYNFIVDSIKEANGQRLGKLAWEMESKIPREYSDALSYLKKLLPNSHDKSKFLKDLNVTIATLHVPDFLPKQLWKHGIEIVEKYFGLT